MGTKQYIQETFTASTGKKAKLDYILPAGLGALALFDGGHSAAGFGAGVPVPGTLIPNAAYDDAKALIPAGDATTLGAIFNHTGGSSPVGMGKERTSKGGLHIACRQDTFPANNGMNLDMGSALRAYILANPANDFYISLWERVTRAGLITLNPPLPSLMIYNSSLSATSNFEAIFDQSGIARATYSVDVGYASGSRIAGAAPNVVGNAFRNIGTIRPVGTIAGGAIYPTLIPWGAVGAWSSFAGANPTAMTSRILYRAYIEDLTVSGRSYAEVDVADYALWQAAFAAGGRYYNDTFTEPATLAGA